MTGSACFALFLGLPLFIGDEARRVGVCAKLDVFYFILYDIIDPANSVASSDAIRYIYSTFPIAVEK